MTQAEGGIGVAEAEGSIYRGSPGGAAALSLLFLTF